MLLKNAKLGRGGDAKNPPHLVTHLSDFGTFWRSTHAVPNKTFRSLQKKNQIIPSRPLNWHFRQVSVRNLGDAFKYPGPPFPARKCNIPVFYRQGLFIAPPTQTDGEGKKSVVLQLGQTSTSSSLSFSCVPARILVLLSKRRCTHGFLSYFFYQPWKGKSRYLHHKTLSNPSPPIHP